MTAASTIAPAHSPSTRSPHPSAPEIVEPATEHRVQCMQALARANEVRLARAALKREVAAGHREVMDVISELPWEAQSMSLLELLASQRRWGRQRSRKLLNSVGLSENKELGTLTERQQGLLVRALEAKIRERVAMATGGAAEAAVAA
jgi:hypothetical protein